MQSIALIIAITTITFWRASQSGFVQWDDNVFLLQNPLLQKPLWEALRSVWTQSFFGDYLPLTQTSFIIENALWGLNPTGFHLINLLIHILNVLLLWRILSILFQHNTKISKQFIIFIILIFAIHPLQTETVMWISERKGLLSAFFALLAIEALLRSTSNSKAAWKFSLFYLLSLLAKSTFIFLPILPLMGILNFQSTLNFRHRLKYYAPGILLMMLWMVIRITAYQGYQPGMANAFWSSEHWLNIPGSILNTFGFYLKMGLIPYGQSILYADFSYNGTTILQVILGVLFLLSLLWLWIKNQSITDLFFILILILPLLPILQIIPRINYLQDRYAYIPIIGIAYFLVALLIKLPKLITQLLLTAMILSCSILTMQRSKMWVSNDSLWTQTALQEAPWSGVAQLNYGYELLLQNKFDQAEGILIKASEVGLNKGVAPLAYNLLANLYQKRDPTQISKAELSYLKCLNSPGIFFDHAVCKFNLANLYLQTQNKSQALSLLEEIIQFENRISDLRILELIRNAKDLKQQLR